MVEKVNALIKDMGLFSTINFFGGMEQFREMVINNPELKPFLDELRGSCSVSYIGEESYPDAYFDFYILGYDIIDEDFVELIVDMKVDFSNLSGEEIYDLKKWFGAVADDHGFEIYDVENLPSHQNIYIKSFNGKPYTWPGYDIIDDYYAFELLDKTGLWEGMIRESVEEEDDNVDYGNDILNVGKKRLFRIWDNQGYAKVDETLMRVFEIERRYEDIVNEWVVRWNKKHNISPTKYFEDDGYKFYTLNNEHLYYSDDSKQITVSDGEGLSGDVWIHRIDINTNNESANVWFEIMFDSITEPAFEGKSFDEYYDYDNMDEDDYMQIIDSYREDFIWLSAKYIRDKYTDKMGYYLEMDFS